MRRLKRTMSVLMATLLLSNTISFAEVMDISPEALESLQFLKKPKEYKKYSYDPEIFSTSIQNKTHTKTTYKKWTTTTDPQGVTVEEIRNVEDFNVDYMHEGSWGPNLSKMILHYTTKRDVYGIGAFDGSFSTLNMIRLQNHKDLEILRNLSGTVKNVTISISTEFENFVDIGEILKELNVSHIALHIPGNFDFTGLSKLESLETVLLRDNGVKRVNFFKELGKLTGLRGIVLSTSSKSIEATNRELLTLRTNNRDLVGLFYGPMSDHTYPSGTLLQTVNPSAGNKYILEDFSRSVSGVGGYNEVLPSNVTKAVDGAYVLNNPIVGGYVKMEPEKGGELYLRNPIFHVEFVNGGDPAQVYKTSIHKVENSWGQELTFDKFKLKSDYTTGHPGKDYEILSVNWNGHTLTSAAPTAPGLIKGEEQEVTTEGIATVKPIVGTNFNVPVQITYSDSLNAIYDGEVEPQTYTRGLEPFDQETITFTKPLPSGTTVTVIDPPDTSSYGGNIGETRIEIVEVVTTFRDSSSKIFEMPVTIIPSIADTFMKDYNESEFEIDIQQNLLLKKSDLYKKAETITGQIPEDITILEQPDSSIIGSHKVPVIFSGFTDGSEYKGDITIYVRDEVPPVITAPTTLPKGISNITISTDEDSSYTIYTKKGILNSIIEVGGGQLVANTPTKVEVDTELLANNNTLTISAKDEYDNESSHTISLQDADDFFENEITVEVDGGGNLLDPDNPNIGDDGQIDSIQMFTISDKYPNKADEIQSRLDYIQDRVQVNNTGSTTVNVSHQGLASITDNQTGNYSISYNIAISTDDFEYKTILIAPVELKNPAPIQTNQIKTHMTKLKGTGQPSATLNIFLQNDGIPTQTTTIDEDGNWTFEGLDLHELTELTLTQEKQFEYGKSYDTIAPTVEYNTPPILTITNPTDQTINQTGIITISGTVKDVDNDNVTITATINGITKSTTVNNTSTKQAWSLSWTGAELHEGVANTTTVQATDSPTG